ncbi:MAG: ArsR/SmtB family transcription factor [bacterium]
MEETVRLFKALSDETRLRIVTLLQHRNSLCVCEITQALDISQTRASRNLGILRDAGLVTSRREGLWVEYSLERKGMSGRAAALGFVWLDWTFRCGEAGQEAAGPRPSGWSEGGSET